MAHLFGGMTYRAYRDGCANSGYGTTGNDGNFKVKQLTGGATARNWDGQTFMAGQLDMSKYTTITVEWRPYANGGYADANSLRFQLRI